MFDQTPFIRYVTILIAGILVAGYGPPLTVFQAALFPGTAVLLVMTGMLFRKKGALFNLALLSAIAGAGFLATHLSRIRFQEGLDALSGNYTGYMARVTSLPEKRGKTLRYEAHIRARYQETARTAISARALLYIPARTSKIPAPGDLLLVKGKLRRPPGPSVSFEFDYARYLETKGIAWIGFPRDRDFTVIRQEKTGSSIALWPLKVSDWADSTLRAGITDDDAYGLVKAMLLGRRDDIRSGLYDAFVGSGTIHILSVSGLHVGIFFMFLHFIFGALRKRKQTRLVYLILIIFCLIFYALVTGAPPSVRRAVVMSVVWVVADTFARRHQPVNTLAVAAFILLVADPFVLFNVGFQLSFAAMLGIFLWYDPLVALYTPTSVAGRHLWQVAALSVAAQLMTFPLSIFYFHQFPTYFLPVNLLVVDIAGLLLPVALVFLLFSLSPLSSLTALTGKLTGWLALLTNKIVLLPEKLPWFLVEGLYLDRVQVCLLYLFLCGAYGVWKTRNAGYLKVIAGISFVFFTYTGITDWLIFHKSVINTYNFPNGTIYAVKVKNKVYLIANEFVSPDTLIYERKLKNYITYLRADTTWVFPRIKVPPGQSAEAL